LPYGLYRAEGYISAHLAEQTGFNEDDLNLFWEALTNMWDHDHSAARGKMNARKLIVFKHSSTLGNAPAHKLFDLVTVTSKNPTNPARSFSDYEITINKNVPSGVEVQEKF
jgi:CRISPR-associated protein Csd2